MERGRLAGGASFEPFAARRRYASGSSTGAQRLPVGTIAAAVGPQKLAREQQVLERIRRPQALQVATPGASMIALFPIRHNEIVQRAQIFSIRLAPNLGGEPDIASHRPQEIERGFVMANLL